MKLEVGDDDVDDDDDDDGEPQVFVMDVDEHFAAVKDNEEH